MRFGWLAALGVALALGAGPGTASAVTVLPVTGGPGLDQGQICASGSLCPGTPTYSLVGTAPVTGSFTFDPIGLTASFTLTLTADASFGGVSILAGSTFSATGVPVITVPLGTGIEIVQSGSATGTVSPFLLSPIFPIVAQTPAVSSLTCSIGTGSDQCGVSLGPSGLTFSQPGGNLDTFVTFNVNVPEPASLSLVGAGIAILLVTGRRRPYQD